MPVAKPPTRASASKQFPCSNHKSGLGVALSHYQGMLGAIVGLAILIGVAAASIRAARRRMSHETWWQVHLFTYLARISPSQDIINPPAISTLTTAPPPQATAAGP